MVESDDKPSYGREWEHGPREACGVFGIYAPGEDVARLTFYGLFALQHRGQESAGIATSSGGTIHIHTGMGLAAQVFDEPTLGRLQGNMSIGHTRYSTTGSSRLINAQPLLANGPAGSVAVAHNGNLVNSTNLRHELEDVGVRFATSTDTEAIAQALVRAPGATWLERIAATMRRMRGSYSLAILTPDALYAVRDPIGNRPLCVGKVRDGWVVASESCALDLIGAQFLREIEPGEILQIDDQGVTSVQAETAPRSAFCIFEYTYIARPDSVLHRQLVYTARQEMGAQLAREHPVEADLVIGVPDTARAAGLGYAQEAGIPYAEGLVQNRYVGRTFINPDQNLREAGVRVKFNPLPEVIRGKRLVVVDDSIVRGTTTSHVVSLLRQAGAREVHMRITTPAIIHPCYYGVDMATHSELIAARLEVSEVSRFIGADSLAYLSLDGLIRSIGLPEDRLCTACLTGDYPIPVQLELSKLALEVS
ncbi:MAG TPA: amidophosphoribosyltransferase [Dehalococcoidia bacterium]|nr:amidophosphoribosyltransferase [Dehalococcoidia bacterium]